MAPWWRIQARAAEVSRPPEKAMPTRSPLGRDRRILLMVATFYPVAARAAHTPGWAIDLPPPPPKPPACARLPPPPAFLALPGLAPAQLAGIRPRPRRPLPVGSLLAHQQGLPLRHRPRRQDELLPAAGARAGGLRRGEGDRRGGRHHRRGHDGEGGRLDDPQAARHAREARPRALVRAVPPAARARRHGGEGGRAAQALLRGLPARLRGVGPPGLPAAVRRGPPPHPARPRGRSSSSSSRAPRRSRPS